MKKLPIEVFSKWAETGKDIGMQEGHKLSVDQMIKFATKNLKRFSFIDAGCGNGWVVRDISKFKECKSAITGSLIILIYNIIL